MSDSIFTVINGAAGAGRCAKRAGAVMDRLREAGLLLEIEHTHYAGHASELVARAYDRGTRKFLAVGGDGTCFEVINGLFPRCKTNGLPQLGILPLGTGNSFLRDFGISDEEEAIRALLSGHTSRCDVVELEHQQGAALLHEYFQPGL